MENSQFNVLCNVTMRRVDNDTGKETIMRFKNRATKIALLGIAKLIYGTYSLNPSECTFYTPRFLAVGSNSGHSSVTVNDVRLDSEYDFNEDYQRVELASRVISNSLEEEHISVSFAAYISSKQLVDKVVGEAGLFSGDSDDSCFARITFPQFVKGPNEVIDITWDITLISAVN